MTLQYNCEFDLDKTLSSGQTLSWTKLKDYVWIGCIQGSVWIVLQDKNSKTIKIMESNGAPTIDWRKYFGLDDMCYEKLAQLNLEDYERKALEYCKGITILNQDPFDVMIDYIIWQNNSTANAYYSRLKICSEHGTYGVIQGTELGEYPRVEDFCKITEEQFHECKTGYRAKYLAGLDAGELTRILEQCKTLTGDERHELLKSIKGIGDKIATCVAVFGYHDLTRYTIDTNLKKIKKSHEVLKEGESYGGYAGVLAQYVYLYSRNGAI